MAVTTAKIRAREKETGKKAYTGIDAQGNLHYAFDNATLQSIIQKANVGYQEQQSAKAYQSSLDLAKYNNEWNASQVDKMNAFNADQAQSQMDFQERMSNTSHQREVKDLIAAGLNPVLSANNGASSPAGSSVSGGAASADTSATNVKAQLFMQQMQVGAQLAQTQANIESAQKMAKWQNELNREISLASLSNQKDIANIQAAASMYGADQSSSASAYAAQMASAASKYSVDNPNNAFGSIYKDLKKLLGIGDVGNSAKKSSKGINFNWLESAILGLRSDSKKASDKKNYGY